jgi:putative colanic acid biosynthesis acetyltransferase WcaB
MILLEDLKYVRGNYKGAFFIVLFRISCFFAQSNIVVRIIGLPYRVFYLVFVQWILGIDIPDRVRAGKGLNVWHGQGLIIHPKCILGENVQVRHNTTIGQKHDHELPPRIGNNVNIGPHCIILGDILVGDNSIIGAGTFVNKDIPANSIVYGNPMTIRSRK